MTGRVYGQQSFLKDAISAAAGAITRSPTRQNLNWLFIPENASVAENVLVHVNVDVTGMTQEAPML